MGSKVEFRYLVDGAVVTSEEWRANLKAAMIAKFADHLRSALDEIVCEEHGQVPGLTLIRESAPEAGENARFEVSAGCCAGLRERAMARMREIGGRSPEKREGPSDGGGR